MTEKAFQALVLDALRRRGWICFVVPNMRMTTAGLPDILALHVGRPILLALELKKMGGKATSIQKAVIEILSRVSGIEARIVYPNMWPALLEELDR